MSKKTEKVKVAHMSDLHYSSENLQEADRCFTAAVTKAIEAQVDCAIITGDSTDHALDAHQPALRALARQIQRLADTCPVLMLQGTFSHEPQGFLRLLAMVGSRHPITVADRIGSFGLSVDGKAIEPIKRSGTPYKLVFHTLPTLNKADIASAMPFDGEPHVQARQLIASVLEGWAPVNRLLRKQGIPSMVLSHGTVFSSVSEHGVPMAGTDHELELGLLFASEATGVALGHIHKQQEWHEDQYGFAQVVAYAGSIGRFHHGEIGDKCWLEWDLCADSAGTHKHATPAKRTIDLNFEGAPDLDFLRARAHDCEGAHVRVRYAVDEESRDKVDRAAIRAILADAGVLDVQIEGRILIVQRQRAAGISSVTLDQKLQMWCEATDTNGFDGLKSLLDLLMNSDPEQIAKKEIDEIINRPLKHQSKKPKGRLNEFGKVLA